MPASNDPQRTAEDRVERISFKSLLATNVNYFGNLAGVGSTPVIKIISDTTYEQLTCIGFNPDNDFLEATIAIKRPTGYSGDLCSKGSTEYVRFFVDYGSGWEDAGLAAVNVHDLPTNKDCEGKPDKPLTYSVNLRL